MSCLIDDPVGNLPRLWISQINEEFDPGRDKVVGPYCFQGKEAVYKNWEELDFASSMDCPERLMDGATRVRRLMNAMVPRLAREFNDRLAVRYDVEYWRILLIPWLLFLMPAVYMRVSQLQEVVDRYKDTPLAVHTADTPPDLSCQDPLDMWNRVMNSHGFGHWLNSLILREIAPENWTFQNSPAGATPPASNPPQHGLMHRLTLLLRSKLRCRNVAGVGAWATVVLSAYLSILPKKQRRHQEADFTESHEREGFPAVFLNVLDRVTSLMVPDSLGKDFAARDEQARRFSFSAGKINLVGPVLFLNEAEKFRLAHATSNGELIVPTQHGGQGYQLLPLPLVETEYKQDAYFTWGWDNQNGYEGRFVPLPSPMLSKWHDRHEETEASIYLVGNDSKPFDFRLQTTELRGRWCAEGRREKFVFYETLQPEIQDNLIYRPYPNNPSSLEDTDFFTRNLPSMQIMDPSLSSNVLVDRLMQCRMLVTDHPVTAFSIAMAANIPTIGFWNPQAWPMTPQAKGIFHAMETAGIVYQTGAEAAAAVNTIWEDVAEWWNGRAVQEVRNEFCRHYGQTERLWLPAWLAALRAL